MDQQQPDIIESLRQANGHPQLNGTERDMAESPGDETMAATAPSQDPKPVIEFSFGTFWNWFLPSCLDVWSAPCSSEVVIAYGAKSFLFLTDAHLMESTEAAAKKTTDDGTAGQPPPPDREWKVRYREIVNAFGYQPKPQFMDAFRSNNSYITTVVFDKTISMIKYGSSSTGHYRSGGGNGNTTSTACAMLFLGNSDGMAALYDCHQRITLVQNLDFSAISRPCCKQVAQKKILSAAWLHYQSEGPVVYYTLDTHLVVWKVKRNKVKIFHDNKQECGNSRFNAALLQISCLASLPAECTIDKSEHKLAIGYMGGKVAILGLDPMTGHQISLTIFAENGHNDDICALSFAPYSLSLYSAYRNGVLCSVSRDSVVKVWSCHNQNEIADHRILSANIYSGGSTGKHTGGSVNNWFTAAFMPRPTVTSKMAFEVMLANSTGDLLTFTLPEKDLNSKLRIGKAQKSFNAKRGNEKMGHSFIIFSIAVNLDRQIAITISLDYKLILWDLTGRHSGDVFYSFSNGALAIDACLTDKRNVVAFGSHIFVLDFKETHDGDPADSETRYNVTVQRLAIPSKNAKFYSVIWNRKNFEGLGKLIIGTSTGELYHYDLNFKSKMIKSQCQDHSKIYSIVWLQTLVPVDEDDVGDPVVLTLHQSGTVMVNYLDGNNHRPQENLNKYLIGVPPEGNLKRTAIINSTDGQRYLIIGNYDGTVDVFDRTFDRARYPDKAFRLSYRFRAFNRPCLSIQFCSKTQWIAVTALHENYIGCYNLDGCDEQENPDAKLVVKAIPNKCRLSGHEDRVSTTFWSPLNRSEEQEEILLASASYDTTCIIWNVATKLPLKRFFGHKSLVYTIRWCHFNPNYIFSGGEDNLFFWNWKLQSDFTPNTKVIEKINVKVNSLKSILNQDQNDGVDDATGGGEQLPPANDAKPKETSNASAGDKSIFSVKSVSNGSSARTKPTAIKALLPLSNQIENNSSKYECLDDIKWLIKLKRLSDDLNVEEAIPAIKLDRILLYGNNEQIERMLALEIEHHHANKNSEGESLLSLYLDPRSLIERAIEKDECDPILAMFAANLSKDLYAECVQKILTAGSFGMRLKWNNYAKEFAALVRLCCLNDFDGAIKGLVEANLYREALILSRIYLASDDFIGDLLDQWHRYRIGQNYYEGAIKCLIAAERFQDAEELVRQRRILCSDTSNASILKQYDDVLEMLLASGQ